MGDFNGDGYSDLLMWNSSAQTGLIYCMNGTNVIGRITFTPGSSLNSGWSVVGVKDFDLNGFSDVLLRDSNGNVEIIYFDGSGSQNKVNFTPAHLNYKSTTYYSSTYGAASGTFDSTWTILGAAANGPNGAAFSSILWYLPQNGAVGLTTLTGPQPQILANSVFTQVPTNSTNWAFADVNGDGTQDLFYTFEKSGAIQASVLYLGQSPFIQGPAFTPAPTNDLVIQQ